MKSCTFTLFLAKKFTVLANPRVSIINNLGIQYVSNLGGLMLKAYKKRLRQNTSNSFIIPLSHHGGHAH